MLREAEPRFRLVDGEGDVLQEEHLLTIRGFASLAANSTASRDDAIREGVRLGIKRRLIADAAWLSKARVDQIAKGVSMRQVSNA